MPQQAVRLKLVKQMITVDVCSVNNCKYIKQLLNVTCARSAAISIWPLFRCAGEKRNGKRSSASIKGY